MKILVTAIVALMLTACASGGSSSAKKEEELAQIYSDMGLNYMQKGDYARAKEKLEQSLKFNDELPQTYHYLAELYSRKEDYATAEKHYKQAIKLAPDDPNMQNNYAGFLCARERIDEAEAMFLKAIHNPSYRTPELAYENLGMCALRVGQVEKAEQYFASALRIRPNLPTSLFRTSEMLFNKQDYFKARAFLERYLAVGAPNPEVLWLGVRIERALGDKAMETQYSDLLRRDYPDSEQAKLLATEGGSSFVGQAAPHAEAGTDHSGNFVPGASAPNNANK